MTTNVLITILISIVSGVSIIYGQHGNRIGPGTYGEIGGLRLSGVETVQMIAGEERQFIPLSTVLGRAGMYREVEAPTKWSVTKADGVKMDDKGTVTIAPGVKHGTRFTVTADVAIKEEWEPKGYEATVRQEVVVYDPRVNPLVGVWHQKSLTTCSGKKVDADGRTGLKWLEFRADGTYSVAISPFEAYRDFWGKYTFNAKTGTLSMPVESGNNASSDLRTEGNYAIAAGSLTLTKMQLYPELSLQPAPCRTHFEKYPNRKIQ